MKKREKIVADYFKGTGDAAAWIVGPGRRQRGTVSEEQMTQLFLKSKNTDTDAGGAAEVIAQKAAKAYTEAMRAGDSHVKAIDAAAAASLRSAYHVEGLIRDWRKVHAVTFAFEFKQWRKKMSPNEAALKVASIWGFGNGKADKQGRTVGPIDDLKALLADQGCDVSGITLKALRKPRR